MYKYFVVLMLIGVVLFAGCQEGKKYHTSSGMINPPPASGAPGRALKNLDQLPLVKGDWVMLVAWNEDGAGENVPACVDSAGNLLPQWEYYSLAESLKWQRTNCPPAFRYESKLYTALAVAEDGAEKRLALSDLREVEVKPGETDPQALARYWRQPNAADPAPGKR